MGKINVLIVEDQPVFSDIMKGHLISQKEIRVMAVVKNGSKALEYLSKTPVHVVLMDTQMPLMDGFEATKKVIQLFQNTYVITTLLKEDVDLQVKMLDAGASGYIHKSATSEQFLKAIVQVMKKGIYYDSQTFKQYAFFVCQNYFDFHYLSYSLSEDEQKVIQLLIDGFTPDEISILLSIKYRFFFEEILRKFDVKQTISLIHKAFRHKWADFSYINTRTYLH